MVTIFQVKSKKDLKQFERVPELLHRNDLYFVPPFPGSICKIFSEKSPFHHHGELLPFIALKDGKPAGRIAAVVNRSHNKYYGDKTGFFGFFDFIDDIEVARALVDRAKQELKLRGCETIRGPYGPTSNDECGLLTEGFDTIPMVMMPYNPSYYLGIYEKLGFEPIRDLYAYYMTSQVSAPEKVKRICERVKKRSGVTLRNINLKKIDDELRIIQKLYNETLNRNWGFVPVQYEDLQYAASDLKAIINPELVMIGEKDGEPMGFSMVIPNINEFMWKAKTSKGLARILKFVWLMKTKKPKEVRLAILGVRPEYQASGIAAVFYYETLMRGKNSYIGGELSWIEANNEPMIRSIDLMGGKNTRTTASMSKGLPDL